jgi:C-terminal processing protease CtpA/Prc
VLTNRRVYSAGNMFVSYMSHFPHVTLVGDQTGGGGGLPYSGELLNGWRYRFSSSQGFDANMQHIELGVPPDVKVDLTPEAEFIGIDTIIETALKLLGDPD